MPILPRQSVLALSDYPSGYPNRRDFVQLDSGELNGGLLDGNNAGLPADAIWSYPQYTELLAKLASFWEVNADQVLLTNGSDNGLLLIAQTFIEPGTDVAVISDPSFVVIPRSVQFAGAKVVAVPVRSDLSFDTDAIAKTLVQKPKLAMLATPDNPTGQTLRRELLLSWIESNPETLFVIDEAYFDFSGITVLDSIHKHENLLVTRTFSKAWGMAGLRVGAILGNPKLISYLARVRPLYDINGAAVTVLASRLAMAKAVAQRAQQTLALKEQIVAQLKGLRFTVVSGSANFFLLRLENKAASFTQACLESGILVRNCSAPHVMPGSPLYGAVRISVGRSEEMARLIEVASKIQNG